jgi:hypothetical protein
VTVEMLEAELAAIDLWDRLYLDLSDPPKVETDACATRLPYTDYITTTNWWIGSSVDDGTDDEGTEIVCWPTVCRDWGRVDPRTGEHPIYKKQPLK